MVPRDAAVIIIGMFMGLVVFTVLVAVTRILEVAVVCV